MKKGIARNINSKFPLPLRPAGRIKVRGIAMMAMLSFIAIGIALITYAIRMVDFAFVANLNKSLTNIQSRAIVGQALNLIQGSLAELLAQDKYITKNEIASLSLAMTTTTAKRK